MPVARYLIDGLASGFVIALMGLGVVVIYRSTRVLTFAQGALASFNAYLFFQFSVLWGWPVALAFAVAVVAAAGVGAASERLAIAPLRRADPITRTVATLGLVLALQVGMRVIWGGSEQFVPPLVRGTISIGSETVGAQTLLIVGVTAVVTLALAVWFRRSLTGLALAATADDPTAASLLGVSAARVSIVSWVLASTLGALAGILLTPLLVLNPWQMTFLMVSGYAAALIGGFVSLPLTVAGGVVIGIVRSAVTSEVAVAGLSETLGFIAVFAVLVLTRARTTRPADLLGGERTPL
ncbi:MAG: branched-chain amino acid ABC transporter permease [Actinomycetota bacterium]